MRRNWGQKVPPKKDKNILKIKENKRNRANSLKKATPRTLRLEV